MKRREALDTLEKFLETVPLNTVKVWVTVNMSDYANGDTVATLQGVCSEDEREYTVPMYMFVQRLAKLYERRRECERAQSVKAVA